MTGALIIVDMQNDFVSGSLAVPGAEPLVVEIAARAREAEAAGTIVVATADWHPASHSSFATKGGQWPPHCVMATDGASLVTGIVAEGMYVFRKGFDPGDEALSGFKGYATVDGQRNVSLDNYLRSKGVTSLEVVGLATDYCVKETAVDGALREYEVLVPARLTRPLTWASGVEALRKMEREGVSVI